jgi:hypothetical protein
MHVPECKKHEMVNENSLNAPPLPASKMKCTLHGKMTAAYLRGFIAGDSEAFLLPVGSHREDITGNIAKM